MPNATYRTGMDPETFERPVHTLDRANLGPLFAAVGTPDDSYRAERDRLRLTTALGRTLALMLDGRWHTIDELRARDVGGHSGDRRGRQLRSLGFTVERELDPTAPPKSGIWRYRLTGATPELIRNAEAKIAAGLGHLGTPGAR